MALDGTHVIQQANYRDSWEGRTEANAYKYLLLLLVNVLPSEEC